MYCCNFQAALKWLTSVVGTFTPSLGAEATVALVLFTRKAPEVDRVRESANGGGSSWTTAQMQLVALAGAREDQQCQGEEQAVGKVVVGQEMDLEEEEVGDSRVIVGLPTEWLSRT